MAIATGEQATAADVNAALALRVAKSLFDAHTILVAVSNDTPVKLDVAASRIIGRKSTGNIVALTAAEALAILGPDVGEGHILLLPAFYNSIGQGTWVLAISASFYHCAYFYNSTQVDGDNFSWKATLQKGTYTLRMLVNTGTNRGIIDVDIGGVEVTSKDLYAGAGVTNVVHTEAGIVIATSGIKDITLRVDGKHASSSDYTAHFQEICLWRTA